MNNIAIFIDGDNISGGHYQKILDEMKRNGRVLIQRLYADFSQPTSNQWREYIFNYGIEAIQTFRIAKKESTDNTLIVDCMKTLYNYKNIHTFVIVSSDSDFSSLASEIRLRGQFCIGIGYNHTPLKLRNNCDKFISIESLIGYDKEEKEEKEEKGDKKDKKEVKHKYITNKGLHAFLESYFQCEKIAKYNDLCDIAKKYQYTITKDILDKMKDVCTVNDTVYWLRLGNTNIRDTTLKIIEETDRGHIHMSWLKDRLLNVDSSFDQKMWGSPKMSDYVSIIIRGTDLKLTKDGNNEFVISK